MASGKAKRFSRVLWRGEGKQRDARITTLEQESRDLECLSRISRRHSELHAACSAPSLPLTAAVEPNHSTHGPSAALTRIQPAAILRAMAGRMLPERPVAEINALAQRKPSSHLAAGRDAALAGQHSYEVGQQVRHGGFSQLASAH